MDQAVITIVTSSPMYNCRLYKNVTIKHKQGKAPVRLTCDINFHFPRGCSNAVGSIAHVCAGQIICDRPFEGQSVVENLDSGGHWAIQAETIRNETWPSDNRWQLYETMDQDNSLKRKKEKETCTSPWYNAFQSKKMTFSGQKVCIILKNTYPRILWIYMNAVMGNLRAGVFWTLYSSVCVSHNSPNSLSNAFSDTFRNK